MAASIDIFNMIKLPPELYDSYYLPWADPLDLSESIDSYCQRLAKRISHKSPVLIGVSFGGVIAQETSKYVDARLCVIISSVKSVQEFPRRMKLARSTGLHRLLPTSLAKQFKVLRKMTKGKLNKQLSLYERYIHRDDQLYLDWALDRIIHWNREQPIDNIVHVQGTKDPVFPIKYIQNRIPVQGGTHIMIINRYKWFNENLPEIISSRLS
jgi:hypothetical protein